MKRLVVYHSGSIDKFQPLYDTITYSLEEELLVVRERDRFTGEEVLIAAFKEWDYFIIENDL